MANNAPFVARRVYVDSRLIDPAGVYHGGLLLASADGAATVAIYDGIDATGELIDYFGVAASGHEARVLDRGALLKRALYIDLGSNISAFTIYYDPAP